MNEDLRLRTKQFALRIIRMFVALPKTDVARVLGRQVLRSGTSVGANYREAYRARSKSEFISKMGDCLKELEETELLARTAGDSITVSSRKMAALLRETNELLAIFTTHLEEIQRQRKLKLPKLHNS